jgi:hypothetical protein
MHIGVVNHIIKRREFKSPLVGVELGCISGDRYICKSSYHMIYTTQDPLLAENVVNAAY